MMLIKLMLGLLEFKKTPFLGMKDLFAELSIRQNPETLFITCSDSRIDPNLITQAHPGDLFSIRNIGNIIPTYPSQFSETGAIEYALKMLEIKDIIVCGHSNCGAMKGLLTPHIEDQLPAVASWLTHAHEVLREVQEDKKTDKSAAQELEIATKKNIVKQMEHLKTYPFLNEKIARKEITIHGWYYELETGKVFIYESDLKEFVNLEFALSRALEARKYKIVSKLCMDYLQKMTPVSSTQEYNQLMELLTKLQDNVLAIWEFIKEPARQQLWKEIGGFYINPEDPEFMAMFESSKMIRLTQLEEFRKSITVVPPSSPLLRASIFKQDLGKASDDEAKQSSSSHIVTQEIP